MSRKRTSWNINLVREYLAKYRYCLVSDMYVNAESKLDIICPKGHQYSASLHSFTRGRRCPKCAWNAKLTQEEAENLVLKSTDGTCELVSEYLGSNKSATVRHTECGTEWGTTVQNISRNGNTCPRCVTSSKGEREIERVLLELGVDYTREFSFPDQRKRYDFGVYSKGDLKFLLEYDGIQHFEPVEYFGGTHKLVKQQISDVIKTSVAIEMGVPLERITYKEYSNIECKITELIEKYK